MPTQIAKDGIWTWFNSPEAIVAGDSLYIGSHCGPRARPVVYRVDLSAHDEVSSAYLQPLLGPEIDDHNNPALIKLVSGKILAAWTTHELGTNFNYCSLTSSTSGDIGTFGAPVQVTGTGDTYAQLLQSDDTANTVWWMTRRLVSGTNRPQFYRQATGADPTNFAAPVEFMTETDERPYFRWFQETTPSARFDFFFNNCGYLEGDVGLYHGYLTVASDGTWTAYQTDGTEVGGVGDLPFSPSQFTQVRDPVLDDWIVLDGRTYNGTPVCLSSRLIDRLSTTAEYWISRWTGSAWESEEVVNAYEPGVSADLEDTASPGYTGGARLDPASPDIVIASRAYVADTDFRVEQYTKSGSWTKTADISGNTGDKNARPLTVRYAGMTYVIWWRGAYLTYKGAYNGTTTGFQTNLWMSPDLSLRTTKAATPILNANYAPVGSKLLLPFQEASGTPVDLRGTYTGTLNGSLTWTNTALGYHVSGFSTSNYVTFDTLVADWVAASATFPRWMAVMCANTDTTAAKEIFTFGYSVSDTRPDTQLFLNTNGTFAYSIEGNTGSSSTVTSTTTNGNDGNPHVVMAVELANNNRILFVDGTITGTPASATITTQSNLNRGTLGVFRGNTVLLPFLGQIYAFALGWGVMPNPPDLYLDWINGRFSGMGGADMMGGIVIRGPWLPIGVNLAL